MAYQMDGTVGFTTIMDNVLFCFRSPDGMDENDWERPTRFCISNLSWKDVYK